MKSTLRVALNSSPEQNERLKALQVAFAQVCNSLAPLVQQSRCWNRVTLHHLTYKSLRQQFPQLGSQMVCNAIYSVSRTARGLFQHPQSPFHLSRLGDKPLPLIRFLDSSPVYFDRHTLSLKAGILSLFTLDGRMHFQVGLRPLDEKLFHEQKLREVVLSRRKDGVFELSFLFGEDEDGRASEGSASPGDGRHHSNNMLPEYVKVEAVA